MSKTRKSIMKSRRNERAAEIAAQLPEDRAALLDSAAQAVRQLDAAVMACDDDAALAAIGRYEAVIWKLNGATFFACRGNDDAPGYVVERYCAAEPGTVPLWGQTGEFLVTVEGIRAVVEVADGFSGVMQAHFSFHSVDHALPFISETGYRSHFTSMMGGMSVGQAAEEIMRAILAERGRLLIAPESRAYREKRSARPWLAGLPEPAATYEDCSGQIAFGF